MGVRVGQQGRRQGVGVGDRPVYEDRQDGSHFKTVSWYATTWAFAAGET